MTGFKEYMSWVKSMLIKGKQVTIAMLKQGGLADQYDHIVTVLKVGTNHGVTDATYYDDDVLYIDDHGSYSF